MRGLSRGAHGLLIAERQAEPVLLHESAYAPVPGAPAPAHAAAVHDSALPAAAVLLGPEAEAMISAAYAVARLDVVDLAIRQVLYEPGSSLVVRYAATLARTSGTDRPESESKSASESASDAKSEPVVESVVAAIDIDGPAPGALVLEAKGMQVGVFRWPHDPALPGLLEASDTAVHPEWWEPCGDELALEVLTYRPGRRAVIRGAGSGGTVFVKVLSPRRAKRVGRRLTALHDAGLPVPRIVHQTESGVLVLEALPGRTMRELLTEGRTDELPSPRALLAMLDRLPSGWVGTTRAVDPPTLHAERHGRLVSSVVPELAPRVDALVARLADAPAGAPVPVHGDFHDDQVLVANGEIVGLLDVDGSGTGSRVDDLGTFVGHLANRGLDVPLPAYDAYLAEIASVFGATVGSGALAAQTAATVIGLATGPYRVQEDDWQQRTADRIALAERWAAQM